MTIGGNNKMKKQKKLKFFRKVINYMIERAENDHRHVFTFTNEIHNPECEICDRKYTDIFRLEYNN